MMTPRVLGVLFLHVALGCSGSAPSDGGGLDGAVPDTSGGGLLDSSPPSDAAVRPPATGTIGPEGGELSVGGYTLVIPEGALDAPVEISLSRRDTGIAVSETVEFQPAGLTFNRAFEVYYEGPALAYTEQMAFLWESADGSLEILRSSGAEIVPGTVQWSVSNTHFSFLWRFMGFVADALVWYLRGAGVVGLSLVAAAEAALDALVDLGVTSWALGRIALCGTLGLGWADGQTCCPVSYRGRTEAFCFNPQQTCQAEGGTGVCRNTLCGATDQQCCLHPAAGGALCEDRPCQDPAGTELSEAAYSDGSRTSVGICTCGEICHMGCTILPDGRSGWRFEVSGFDDAGNCACIQDPDNLAQVPCPDDTDRCVETSSADIDCVP